MQVVPPFEQILIRNTARTICVQYLRILFSSFGEEDFQRFALNINYVQFVLGYYFADNVGDATI